MKGNLFTTLSLTMQDLASSLDLGHWTLDSNKKAPPHDGAFLLVWPPPSESLRGQVIRFYSLDFAIFFKATMSPDSKASFLALVHLFS